MLGVDLFLIEDSDLKVTIMRWDDHNDKNFGKGSMNDPYPMEKKKSSFTKILLIGLLLFIAGSYGYEKLVKDKNLFKKERTENNVRTPASEITSEEAPSNFEEIEDVVSSVNNEETLPTEPVRNQTQQIERNKVNTPEEASSVVSSASPASSKPAPPTSTRLSSKPDYSGLSTIEILERQNHESVVKEARRAGVSTEGSTTEILERINHASVVKEAKRAGVSTEGSTTDILERINHASVVKEARRAGVSTEGSTTDILERINHASVVKEARRVGVSTEGSTTDILERINRKALEKYGY